MPLPDVVESVCRARGWTVAGETIEVTRPGGRRQQVLVERFTHEGQEMIRLHSRIGTLAELGETRALAALRLNHGLAHGALAVRGEQLVMVDTLSVADADPGEVDATISFLADHADRYEEQIFGGDRH